MPFPLHESRPEGMAASTRILRECRMVWCAGLGGMGWGGRGRGGGDSIARVFLASPSCPPLDLELTPGRDWLPFWATGQGNPPGEAQLSLLFCRELGFSRREGRAGSAPRLLRRPCSSAPPWSSHCLQGVPGCASSSEAWPDAGLCSSTPLRRRLGSTLGFAAASWEVSGGESDRFQRPIAP